MMRLALFATVLTLAGVTASLGAGSASADTGINEFEMSPSTTQAGGHPDVNVRAAWKNHYTDPTDPFCNCDDARVVTTHFPTGFIGNPHAITTCSFAEFSQAACPSDSQVGTAKVEVLAPSNEYLPLYNMETRPDQAGLTAFIVPGINAPVFFELSSRTDGDYGLDVTTSPIFHFLAIRSSEINLWGVPADPSHDSARFITPFKDGATGGCNAPYPKGCADITGASSNLAPAPYLQAPTTCGVPLSGSMDLDYYNGVSLHADDPWPPTTGCDQLSFNPSLTAQPTTSQADTASGIDINLKVPQTPSPSTPSPSEIRSSRVTLPAGFSISPAAADGKLSCKDADTAIGTTKAATCPEFSKIGTLSLDVSALPGPLPGALYLGEPKPGDRYRVILAADGFGTHVKLVGSAKADPQSGQLVFSLEDLPQSPLQEFDLHVFGAERGLLATPERCGTYPVQSEFVPWDSALPSQSSTSFFTIDSGPSGRPCPVGARPFDPDFAAGTITNTAGAHSPFVLHLAREDGEQNLSGLSVTTPRGFAATLKGIPYCPQAAIDQLAFAAYAGLAELAAPSCPITSQIGTATAEAGAGTRPLTVRGKVYLAGPYKGAPLSLLVVIPAVAGPYDLGNVAVRAAIDVDRATAQITTTADPLPQILEGIPLRTRSIQVSLDRPGFTLNPTNCDPFSVAATALGDEGASSRPAARFQVANCAELGFAPTLALKLLGSTKRRGHPALRAVLRTKPGDANLARTVVALPKSTLLDNAHIGTICTRVQFAADACPPRSAYGRAEAVTPLLGSPLSGPVYLRASNHDLPDLVADLRGQIDIELVGRIDSPKKGGLRATFAAIPDAPVSKFALEMQGGSKGLLINSESLCKTRAKASVQLEGQNGISLSRRTELRSSCDSRKAKKRGLQKGSTGQGR